MGELPAFPLGTILVAEVGSVGLGTALAETSDHDELGVVVETPTQVLGLDERGFVTVMQRSRPAGVSSGPGDTDRTLHSLRRFCRLAAAGNPSVLVAFYAPVVLCHPAGRRLRDLGSAFVGRHVVPRYRGYMAAEKARVVEACGWSPHGILREGDRRVAKDAMHCARLGMQGVELLTTGRLELPIAGERGEWLRAVRRGEVGVGEWSARVSNLDAELELLAGETAIPAGPDRSRIERFLAAERRAFWESVGWL
ncbi:MAG: DNA polymerase beta superfamily protein [Acidimicrobiales bacterium]